MNKTFTQKKSVKTKDYPKNQLNNSLDEFPDSPGKNVINNILNYSKALSIRKLKNGNNVEMILN